VSRHSRVESRLGSIALRHIAPEHVDKALVHYARSAKQAIDEGRLDPKAFDCLDWEHHDAALKSIAADNPHIARPAPEREPLPTIKHEEAGYLVKEK
jgi:hypothetical protein